MGAVFDNIQQAVDGRRGRATRSSSVGVERTERVPMVRAERARYKTATPSLSGRWRSFRRRQEEDDDGVEDDEEAIGLEDCPPVDDYERSFESHDGVPEDDLCVRICKETIRGTLMELMRTAGSSTGSVSRLEDMEAGRFSASQVEKALISSSQLERSVCLLWGCFLGRADLVRALLAVGADAHYHEPSDGLGALHLAAFSGAVDCAKILLEQGIGPNEVHRSFAPLHCAAFGNSVETARLLICRGANVQGARVSAPGRAEGFSGLAECPLHCAVRARAADCVQVLLDNGADPQCVEPGGWTALHVAADRGNVRCVKMLLAAGANVAAVTADRRATALHLAAECGCAEAVAVLLERKADPSARTLRGQTALHLAARAQSLETVELLLRVGGADPNAHDNDMRTPLHASVGKALVAFDMVEVLLSWRANVNASDKYGYTPLHVAAHNELSQCVETLLYHGADVSARTRGGASALSIIARKTPASLAMLYQRLDAAICMHDPEVSHREVELKLDFRNILQHCQKGVETSFLKTFVDEEGQKSFLEHPLCQAFLHLKWQKIRKFYVGRIVLWGVFTALLTLYVLTALAHDCYNEGRNVTITPNFCQNNSIIGGLLRENPVIIEAEWYVLVLLACCEVMRKTHGVAGYSSMRQYVTQSDNIIEWLVIASVPVVSFVYAGKTFVWQNHVGAFAVLFAWTNLMVMIGQLPVFGTYVAMYTRVQAEVAKLLAAYACLLVGFTISFCVMFPAAQTFSNPFVGFIKVLVMMTGELDFEDLLFGDTPSGRPALLLSVSAHLTFVMFLLSVTIVLMNLMVGIAVHDIQGLKKTATLSKLVRQTNLISYIELALFNGYLPGHVKKLLRRSALVSPSGYRVVLHVKPLNPRERRLPKPVLAAAYEVARQRRKGKHTISSHGSSIAPSQRTTFIGRPWQGQDAWDQSQAQAQAHINELTQEVNDLKEVVRELVTALGKEKLLSK